MRRLFDGFLINDELDLLELRLTELWDVVDVFMAIELPVNFRGQEKPLHLLDNLSRFRPWHEKLRYIEVAEIPSGVHPAIEYGQRRGLAAGYAEAAPNDLIMLSDVDEIPNRDVLREIKAGPALRYPVTLEQRLFYYSVNWLQAQPWAGPVLAQGGDHDPQILRSNRMLFQQIPNGGWHFSYFGGAEAVARKLRDLDVEREIERHAGQGRMSAPEPDPLKLAPVMYSGGDIFGRTELYADKRLVEIKPGELHPHGISQWLAKHPQYDFFPAQVPA